MWERIKNGAAQIAPKLFDEGRHCRHQQEGRHRPEARNRFVRLCRWEAMGEHLLKRE